MLSSLLLALGIICSGCNKLPAALDPAGPQSGRITQLWWVYFWITAVVYVLVVLFLLFSVRRKRRLRIDVANEPPLLVPDPKRERRMTSVVVVLVGITTVILFVLMIQEFFTARAVASFSQRKNPMTIKITGHQWWWEVHYPAEIASNILTTANEIHIPVGRPIQFQLQSSDVIHSFWIPNLHGKKDLIPGHPTSTWLQADRPGIFRGQCAEFCGFQHAHMRLVVVAESQEKFNSWLAAQSKPAPTPTTDSAKIGYAVFMSKSCAICHAISGTPANGMVGPNLTHVASRKELAANSFPTARGYFGGWVINPQSLKPGVHMPQNQFAPGELQALLDYLETLK
jgi:cytochrome c oxidase subunit 2